VLDETPTGDGGLPVIKPVNDSAFHPTYSSSRFSRLGKPPEGIDLSIITDVAIYRVAVCPTRQCQPEVISKKGDVSYQSVLDETPTSDSGLPVIKPVNDSAFRPTYRLSR
jgi:hypothetical protein